MILTQEIGAALLPSTASSKALLPGPTEASSGRAAPPPPPQSAAVQKAESIAEQPKEDKVEAAPVPVPETNSAPQTQAKPDSNSGINRPLSPYPWVQFFSCHPYKLKHYLFIHHVYR